MLDILRQPGANIIETADRVKALLPKLRALLPPSVKVDILTDRTQTIRASVADVQFTLILTVFLVIMVIFLFLRKFWATVIPSVSLPLAIIGTFGIMRLANSLDNLSLMALTIATGFVVDDAIVMIENIVRFIEMGDPPMEAALKGASQIGFTVISLSISLIAVFIPLLFMTGIVGRLFREFAITLSVAVVVSAFVSLTLTPMMCARLLKAEKDEKHGRFFHVTEEMFTRLLEAYESGLKWVLRHQRLTLMVAVATLVATIWLYVMIPKGLLPQQDTGRSSASPMRRNPFPSRRWWRGSRDYRYRHAGPGRGKRHLVRRRGSVNATVNTGRHQYRSEAARRAHRERHANHRPAAGEDEERQGISLFMQAVQDVQIDSRVSRTQYQYGLQDADADELAQWAPKLLEKLRGEPALVDVATDQQSQGLQLSVDVDRAGSAPQRADRRPSTTRSTTPLGSARSRSSLRN